MPLATIDLFRPVIAMDSPHLGGFYGLTIDASGTGRGLPHPFLARGLRSTLPYLLPQAIDDLLVNPVIAPLGEIIIDRTLGD